MQYLRRISTRRLLALAAAVVAIAIAGTAIAIAATSGGPVPPPKPLDVAVHDALTAPSPAGVTARIHFTNRLVDSAQLGEGLGGDPVLTGADGRLWASPDGKLRLELQADATSGSGDSQIVVDGRRFTIYDSGRRTVYTGELPADKQDKAGEQPPSLADVQKAIARVMGHANVSEAAPSDVAGRAAYTVRISPKQHGGLVGGAALAWDAINGVPLRAALYAKGSSDPVLELEATDVSFGAVDPSVFDVKPPADAKVVDLAPHGSQQDASKPVEGVDAVQAKLPFTLNAPDTLAGMPRSTVRLISSDRHPAALVTYGEGLDGLAVIETKADKAQDRREFDTPLGTAITFQRGGVTYAVLGSVAPATARAAAAGL